MEYVSQTLPQGTLLVNQYRIERLLGKGGFGVTYLAFDVHLELHVAIKEFLPADLALRDSTQTVRPHSVHQEESFQRFRARFLDEARTLAHFEHPKQGAWSDIYALAGVLYFCFSGQAPVEATERITLTTRGDPDPQPRIEDVVAERLSRKCVRR